MCFFFSFFFYSQIIENVIRSQNSHVRTVDVYQNCGFAILTTIVAMTQMNRPTCADNGTVLPDGRDVRERPITGAYRSGCSVTARMIAVTVRTSFRKTVRNAKLPRTSSVKTIDVYQRDGCVTSKTIAVTIQMSRKTCAKDYTDSVPSLNSSVPTENVYRANGDATMTMIAEIIRMNSTVVVSSARMVHSSVRVDIVSRLTSDATATGTAGTSVMRLVVRLGTPTAGTVLRTSLSVRPLSCVFSILRSVMGKTIVVMVPTKHLNSVVSDF